MKNNNLRSRNYSCITYLDLDSIRAFLCAQKNVRQFAYIYHDKDLKDDGSGELKAPHYHLLLVLNNAVTESALQRYFPTSANTLTQVMRDKVNSFEYLTHKNDPDKAQYDESAIVCNNVEYWKSFRDGGEENEKYLNIIRDLINHVPFSIMMIRYGRDFIIHRERYVEYAQLVAEEERLERVAREQAVFESQRGVCLYPAEPYQENVFDDDDE